MSDKASDHAHTPTKEKPVIFRGYPKVVFLWPIAAAALLICLGALLTPNSTGWFVVAPIEVSAEADDATKAAVSDFAKNTGTIINHIWDRDRPYLELDEIELVFYRATDGSFPSNPVAVGFAAGAGAWMVNRRFGWILFTFGALYGVSRIYIGVFYPTDVLGGAVVGIVSTWLSIYVHRLWQPATALSIRFARAVGLG